MSIDYKKRFIELEKEILEASKDASSSSFIKLNQEYSRLKPIIDLMKEEEKLKKEIEENKKIIQNKEDLDLSKLAEEDLKKLELKLNSIILKLEELKSLKGPNDHKNAILEIRAGAGGDEAALFAADLMRLYLRYAEKKNWKSELIEAHSIGTGGYKELIFILKGEDVFAHLKYEAGTHRVQRIPETEKQGRVHTSTATVNILPEAEELDIEIKPQDIRVDTFCSSGPGGQSVNTTYSAIRITHLATGLVVTCQDQKSQVQNKEKAMQILRSRLLALVEEKRLKEESSTRKDQVGAGNRSDKIKTYNFPQDRLTDHRLNQSWHNLAEIMDGEIEGIINSQQRFFNK